jgi:hypothetical protein
MAGERVFERYAIRLTDKDGIFIEHSQFFKLQ